MDTITHGRVKTEKCCLFKNMRLALLFYYFSYNSVLPAGTCTSCQFSGWKRQTFSQTLDYNITNILMYVGFFFCILLNTFVYFPADGGKTLTFFNNDFRGDFQTVTFEDPEIKKLFFGSFHKVRMPLCVCFFLNTWFPLHWPSDILIRMFWCIQNVALTFFTCRVSHLWKPDLAKRMQSMMLSHSENFSKSKKLIDASEPTKHPPALED